MGKGKEREGEEEMGQVCVSHLENTIRGAITFHIRQNRRGKRNITKVIDDVVR